jgi:hypothetical protein
MPQHAPHCPFLNRADERCSAHFSLERLDHAFAYCFDSYHACPVYAQLLAERRERRAMGEVVDGHDNRSLVQIAIAARNHKPRTAAARVLDPSGV